MFNSGRKTIGIGLAAGLVIASAVGLTSMTSAGDGGNVMTPPSVPNGTVTIDLTDRAGTVTFALGTETFTQSLSVATPCSTLVSGPVLDSSGDPVDGVEELLTFSATGPVGTDPNVQLPSDGLGVTDGANCGEPAGKISPDETLTVALGDFFADDIKVGAGSLSIGKTNRQDRSLLIEYDGETPDGRNPIPIDVGGEVVKLTGPEFRSITLASTANQSSRGLSLKSPTSFDLVAPLGFDAAVPCQGEVEAPSLAIGGAAESAKFFRGNNDDGTFNDDCEDIGVTLRIEDDFVLLDKGTTGIDTGAPQDVNATLTIVWAPVDPSDPTALDREINFFPNNSEDDPLNVYVPVQWCLSTSVVTLENGDTTVLADHPRGPTEPEGHPFAGEEVPWCLLSNFEELVNGEILQVQVYHGKGDPGFK